MKTETVLSAIRSAMRGDREMLVHNLTELESCERNACRNALASKLSRILHDAKAQLQAPKSISCDKLLEIQPQRELVDLWLHDAVRDSLNMLIKERLWAEKLFDNGLKPRNKLLFHGPPGNGKTAAAGGLAIAFGLPLFVADYSSIIGCHIGESEKGIATAMNAACEQPCVLLLDECDSLLSTRDYESSASKAKSSTTNYFLTRMDMLPQHVVLIAATNRLDEIDPACKRRFNSVIEFEAPTTEQKEKFLGVLRKRYPILKDDESVGGIDAPSFAEIELKAEQMARCKVLETCI